MDIKSTDLRQIVEIVKIVNDLEEYPVDD